MIITKVSPIMTSNNAPSPYVASASSVWGSSYPAYKAFNGITTDSDAWITNNTKNGWIKLDTGGQKPITLNGYSITSRNISNGTAEPSAPKSWEFMGSDDNTNWVILDARDSEINWGINETRMYLLKNEVNFRYYMFNINDNNGHTYVAIGEIELLLIEVDAKIEILNPNVIVPKNTDYQFDFEIKAPVVLGEITIAEQMNQSQLGSGTLFQSTVSKDRWNKITSLKVTKQ